MIDHYDEAFQKSPAMQKVRREIKNSKLETSVPIYSQYKTPDYNYDNYVQKYYMRKESIGNFPTIKLKLGERPKGDPNKFAKALSSLDKTWLISDLHLATFGERARDIAMLINHNLESSDNLIIVGNLLNPKDSKQFSLIMRFVSMIDTKNIFLILGSSDIFSVQTYIDMGFNYVTDRAERTVAGKKFIFTYYPIPGLGSDVYNIFGFSNAYTGHYPACITNKNHYSVSAGSDKNHYVHRLRDIVERLCRGGDYYGSHF